MVSFCRAAFLLDNRTASVVLQSCFGGYPQGFRVQLLKDHSFRFSVASNLLALKSTMCVEFHKEILKLFLFSGVMVVRIGFV